jgi:hypothetical protein
VKKVIELLEEALYQVSRSDSGYEGTRLGRALDAIDEAIAALKAPPRWETPERRKERTGEEWPEGAAIYYRTRYRPTTYEDERWTIWRVAKHNSRKRIAVSGQVQIICATEAGCPPDDWKPEEEE